MTYFEIATFIIALYLAWRAETTAAKLERFIGHIKIRRRRVLKAMLKKAATKRRKR